MADGAGRGTGQPQAAEGRGMMEFLKFSATALIGGVFLALLLCALAGYQP